MSYFITDIKNIILKLGEDRAREILSSFSCKLNLDIENFLLYNSINFANQGTAATHLVFINVDDKMILVGYFTLVNKTLSIPREYLSKTLENKIKKFSNYDKNEEAYIVSCPLIAQLSKNMKYKNDNLITGSELLKMALDKVKEAQQILGGKLVYIECEDNYKLIEFYEKHGFVKVNTRYLKKNEKVEGEDDYLIQMLKKF